MFKFNLDPYKRYSLSQNDKIELQTTYDQFVGIKPVGLWYAFGRGWIDLERQTVQGMDDIQLPPLFEMQVDTSRFIKLTSVDDIEQFHSKYGVEDRFIDWRRVVQQFDGLEVIPFNKEYQLHWYRTFDLSSGCVWNLNNIVGINRINAKDYLDFGAGIDSLHRT